MGRICACAAPPQAPRLLSPILYQLPAVRDPEYAQGLFSVVADVHILNFPLRVQTVVLGPSWCPPLRP